MSYYEREALRRHMLDAHVTTLPNAELVRNAEHPELDDWHIEAHTKEGGALS